MADGMLALSWNNHASTFCHMLSHIRLKDKYADATVACEGKFYPVHRIVLSTCSKYFEEMFELTSAGKHPIVLLQDVRKYELEAILSYMYAGVVSVAQKDLARLIKVAELLQIKGLAVPDELPSEKRGGSGQNSGNAGERTSKSSYLSERGEDGASPYRKRRRREEPLLSSRATAVSAGNGDDDDIQEIKTSDYLSKDFRESSDDDNRGFTDPGQSVVNTEGRSMESDRLQRQPSADPTMNSSKDAKEDMLCIKEEVMDEPSDTGGNPVKTEIPYEPLGDNLEESVDLPLNDQDDYSHSSGQMPSESTAEALAGPSGIHEWLSGGDLAAMENYGGEGSPQPSDPSQAQQMEGIGESDPLGYGRHDERSSLRDVAELIADPLSPKLHQCPCCSYASTRKDNLMVHLRTHTGERPYSCSLCHARFGQKGTLNNHMRTHTGEKPFVCSVCTQSFARNSHLKNHMLTHKDLSIHNTHC